MDFDADDTYQYIDRVSYPAGEEDFISSAENNGVMEELIGRQGNFGTLDLPIQYERRG